MSFLVNVNMEGTPVREIITKKDINIFPNPASEYIDVYAGAHCNAPLLGIRIYNSYGQLASHPAAIREGVVRIDVSAYPPGVYFVNIAAVGSITSLKIIKY